MQDSNDFAMRQLRNQNAIEVAKLFSDELNHYRSRLHLSVTSFSALSLLIAGAVQTYSGTIKRGMGALLIAVLLMLTLWISQILLITRRRADNARQIRKKLLDSIDLPLDPPHDRPTAIDFGLPTAFSLLDPIMGITALSWLIVLFVALVPIAAIVAKIG